MVHIGSAPQLVSAGEQSRGRPSGTHQRPALVRERQARPAAAQGQLTHLKHGHTCEDGSASFTLDHDEAWVSVTVGQQLRPLGPMETGRVGMSIHEGRPGGIVELDDLDHQLRRPLLRASQLTLVRFHIPALALSAD